MLSWPRKPRFPCPDHILPLVLRSVPVAEDPSSPISKYKYNKYNKYKYSKYKYNKNPPRL